MADKESLHKTRPKNPNTERVGAIDLGSKNFKFVLGEKFEGRVSTTLIKKERLEIGKEVTGNHGTISHGKLGEIEEVLSDFVRYCNERSVPMVLAIATSAIRNSRNCRQVIEIANNAGISLEVADGAREGVVGYLAATGGAANKFVSDSGSKSTQIAWESSGNIVSHSIPVGYELAYESFVRGSRGIDETLDKYFHFLEGNFPRLPTKCDQFIALAANTITTFVTGIKHSGAGNLTLGKAAIEKKLSELRQLSQNQYDYTILSLPNAVKIIPGLVLLSYLTARTGFCEILVSEAELPVGLIVEHFGIR